MSTPIIRHKDRYETDRLMLESLGFEGFVSIAGLNKRILSPIPRQPGVYVIQFPSGLQPIFLNQTTATADPRDPTVPVETLQGRWHDESSILYIGKAGSPGGKSTLRKRVRELIRYGRGKAKNHAGGAYLWQIAMAEELVVSWKTTTDESARLYEKSMLADFYRKHGDIPFANRSGRPRESRFVWHADDFESMSISQCAFCIHKRPHGPVCDAFPNEIPMEILLNRFVHTSFYEGDNGIVFQARPGTRPSFKAM